MAGNQSPRKAAFNSLPRAAISLSLSLLHFSFFANAAALLPMQHVALLHYIRVYSPRSASFKVRFLSQHGSYAKKPGTRGSM